MLRRSSLALTVHLLSYSRFATASRSVHLPAFSHAQPGLANTVFSSPPRIFLSSIHRNPTRVNFKYERSISWLNSRQNAHLSRHPTLNIGSTCLFASPDNNESSQQPNETSTSKEDETSFTKDLQSIVTLVGAQGLLIPLSMVLAKFLELPNRGLGSSFLFSNDAFVVGVQWTIPLFALAGIMKLIEPYSPALQDVTKATQRSVLAVMGSKRRPIFALLVSMLLGAVAGWGEEWLFRGVFQTKMSLLFGNEIALAVSGLVFGLLHAVTPVYALLAGAASVFFGYLYNTSNNLAVPMVCHAVYDVGALLWAHYTVTALSKEEQQKILEGGPGAPILSTTNKDLA